MAPTHRDHPRMDPITPRADGDRIVISGMSGIYPQCHNVKELCDLLYNKVNPIRPGEARWNYEHPEVAKYTGNVPELERFDAQFFGVHNRLGNHMDAMSRKLLEHSYQAIYDAGLSPEHLSGSNVGCYVGVCFSESEKVSSYVPSSRTGFGIVGSSKAMMVNRISFWLNAKGPSVVVDEACCSSMLALEQAVEAIDRGDCEAAVVGAANLSIHPHSTMHFSRLMQMSKDGRVKSFDENADGCVKTEAVSVIFLQKAKNALRAYADVLHVKSGYLHMGEETDPNFAFYRDPAIATKFLKTFYDECGVPPHEVEYVEAFGCGIPEADKAELEAISTVFSKGRQDPLLVGSVMSNIGYAEAATGLSSIIKVLLGYHKGEMAGNLNFSDPRSDVPALQDGRIQIVADQTRIRRGYVAVNNFSFTGCNAHVLLHGRYKPKDLSRYMSNIPYLVPISGRHEDAVRKVLEDLKSRPVDAEQIALLRNIHSENISGHLGRGFVILDTDENRNTVSLVEKCEYSDVARRPLWFVYSGMGSQWTGMGAKLMRIPAFAASIERSHRILQPKGIDLINIITSEDKTTFNNVLNSFLGIASIQIALTDVLRAMGLVPDKIIGHSLGEHGCAYADGCFTAEEMLMAAYSRGMVSIQTPFIHGSMAAVGLGYQQIKRMIPPEIQVACHNSSESSTLSGPSEVMKEFVASLTAKGIFAKEVPCSNIPYHSQYIADAGPTFFKYLSKAIKNPRLRTERWISTSVPQSEWNEDKARYSSAEYHTNNLLSPVLFEEVTHMIPPNAVLVEIAPHGLLQAILKRSLPPSCTHIPLTRRGHPDNAMFFLEAVGKLFMEGYNIKVDALYPKVEFPVSTETPMLSHIVEWMHNEKWNLPLYLAARKKIAASSKFVISIHDEEHSYLRGHVVGGKNTYPFAASLVAAWDTIAMLIGVQKKKISVEFRDVHLHVEPVLHERRQLRLSVVFHRGTGRFEVMNENSKVVSGFIFAKTHPLKRMEHENEAKQEIILNSDDVYQMFHEREYYYTGDFRSIHTANISLSEAYLQWNNNWVTLITSMLQMNALKRPHDGVSQPVYIRNLSINVKEHYCVEIFELDGKNVIKANALHMYDHTRCGGILIENIKFIDLPITNTGKTLLNALKIFPRFQSDVVDMATALRVLLQIAAENMAKENLTLVEILNENKETIGLQTNMLKGIPGLTVQYKQTPREAVTPDTSSYSCLTLVQNLTTDENLFQMLYSFLNQDAFILNVEDNSHAASRNRPSAIYRVVSSINTGDVSLHLAKWKPTPLPTFTKAFTVQSTDDIALLTSTRASLPQDHKLLVLTAYPPIDGVKDLVKKWRRDAKRKNVYLLMINYKTVDDHDLDQLPESDLAYNILDHGSWGGEYYIPQVVKERKSVGNMTLQSKKAGDINSLTWVEVPLPSTPGILVTVHYAGLNNLDAKRVAGIYPINNEVGVDGNSYGMDFSGITTSGVQVMGIVSNGACSKYVRATPELLWPVPRHWTMEEASTVPLPYAHAFYCLAIKTRLVSNRSILVHGGAGALGQAAISISLAHGLNVFTTVSDMRKKHFLRKLFPELKEDHIGNSRDTSFGDMVLTLTKGLGVDYVINCVKGELKNTSLKACGSLAVVLETQKRENFAFGMYHLGEEKNYVTVDFSSIFTEQNTNDMKKIQLMISEGIASGYVRPLSRVSYAPSEAARALRLLEASRHRGRVLLKLLDTQTSAHPRITCTANKSHLIISDNEALGLMLADKIIARGAKKLRLHLPRIPPQAHILKKEWEMNAIDVKVSTEDLTDSKNVISIVNDTIKMGSVEGAYFVCTSANNLRSKQAVLSSLDAVVRQLCTSIKYFAVISTNQSFGNHTIVSRAHDSMPATKLNVSSVKSIEAKLSEDAMSCRDILDTLEQVIGSDQSVIHACTVKETKKMLLQKISEIAGIRIPRKLFDTTTLEEMGVNQDKIQAITVFLRNNHHIDISEEDILALTIQQIREIDQNTHGVEWNEAKGLEVFFSHVNEDELMSSTEMVFLPTLATSATAGDDEFDASETYLCIVPGLEGNHERFRELCESIKVPAVVLQPGLDHPFASIQEISDRYAKILLKRANLKNNFYILGYESGVMVALEMAAILEKHGLTGTVYCVGDAPAQIKSILNEELRELRTDDALQDAVIRHMFGLMINEPCELEFGDSSWKEKVDRCVRVLLGRMPLSGQYARALFEAAYGRIVRTREYKVTPRALQSRLVLLRAARLCDSQKRQDDSKSELQKYSQQVITVHDLEAPLAHAVKDLRCAAVVNQYLHPDILKQFHQKNLCDTYSLQTEMFLTSGANQEKEEKSI